MALAAYGRENYSAKPIMISGTCKTECEDQQARWMSTLINVLLDSADGVNCWGELFSIASDGDATRRKTLHHLLMSRTLDANDLLYDLLSRPCAYEFKLWEEQHYHRH